MELSKTHLGKTPFITNVTVFSSTLIVDGALLVSGATTTAIGATVTVATTTASNADFIGVTQVGSLQASVSVENRAPNSHAFGIPSSGIPNTGSLTTALTCHLPLCINSDAFYMARYSTTTAAATAADTVDTWTASTTTDASRGTTGLDVIGGWLFSLAGTNTAGNTPTFSGSLRYITDQSATTAVTLLTAMNISTDSHMIWAARPWKKAGQLNGTADALRSRSATSGTGFQQNGARMLSVDAYISHDQAPTHPLRKHVDNGLDSLTNVKMYGEVLFTSPLIQELA